MGKSRFTQGILNSFPAGTITRGYDRTVRAYKDILNGDYISDPELKLMIARHAALFEEYADAIIGRIDELLGD
jgi:hypothetical protein